MGKLTGLILMILGIAIIAGKFIFKQIFDKIPFLSTSQPAYIIIAGLILIIAGFFLMKGKRGLKAGEEVPIYEGEGKKRKIVGYRRKD